MPSPNPPARRSRPGGSGAPGSRSSRPERGAQPARGARRGAESNRSTRDGAPRRGEDRRATRSYRDADAAGRSGTTGAGQRGSGSRGRSYRDDEAPTSRGPRMQRNRDGGSTRSGAPDRSRRPRPLTEEQLERRAIERAGRDRGWGGVARKGAVHVKSTGQEMNAPAGPVAVPSLVEDWVEDDLPRPKRPSTTTPNKRPYVLPAEIATAIRNGFDGTTYQRERQVTLMSDAAAAYDRHRYEEALRYAKIVVSNVPGVAQVHELVGLTAYRLERFPLARKHLRLAFELSGDPQHLPQVMDCERAARRFGLVAATFQQLSDAEPTADVAAEGRIVMAGALADQGEFHEAIELLHRAGASKVLRNPSARHIRLWYALGDVLDRAGDTSGAREQFARVLAADPEAYDAATRFADLGGGPVRKNRKKRTVPVSKKKNVR